LDYRPEIDGLRALAVIPVILFHAGLSLFGGGFVGVDVFFVISGYLITSILLKELNNDSYSLAIFYQRRARRILPALFFVALACIPFAWFWLPPKDMLDFAQSLSAVSIFSSNLYFLSESNYFDIEVELKPLLHTWSLAVEEQYYVFFPLLLALIWRVRKQAVTPTLLILAGLSLYFAQWTAYNYPKAGFYLLPTRGWELLIGSLVAISTFKGNIPSWIKPQLNELLSLCGLAFIVIAVFIFDKHTPFPSVYALLPTMGTALIILFATKGTLTNKLLCNGLLVKLGLISYSAYLVHQPLFAFARHRSLGEPSIGLMATIVFGSFVAAYFIWKFIEQPFRTNKQIISGKKLLLLAVCIIVGLFTFGMAAIATDGFSGRYSKHQLAQYQQAMAHEFEWNGCNLDKCDSKHTRKAKIVLIGDSHATSIAPSLSAAFSTPLTKFAWRTNGGCPPLMDFYVSNTQSNQCSSANHKISQLLIQSDEVEWVIMSAQWSLYASGQGFDNSLGGHETGALNYYYQDSNHSNRESKQREQEVINGYIDYASQLLDAGKKVLIINQIPVAGWHIPNRYLKLANLGQLKNDNFRYPLTAYQNHTAGLAPFRALNHPNLFWAEPSKVLCKDGVWCETSQLPKLLYSDTNHLSRVGADLVTPVVANIIWSN
jgi:peptidoglycan/LPS O-acetylase OafA/YrhL